MNKEEKLYNKKLKEVYDGADGRRSHFLFFKDEPEVFVKKLIEDGWVRELSFKTESGNKMYAITVKLIDKFGGLSKREQRQLDYFNKSKEEKAEIEKKEREEKEEKLRKKLDPNKEL